MENRQENTDNAMAFEALANMIARIREGVDEIADKLSAQPIAPELEQRLTTLSEQLANLKPPAEFTNEQRSWLSSSFRAQEIRILEAIRQAAVPSPVLEQLRQSLERINAFIADPRTVIRHEYSFMMDFKNSRATATILIMGLAIIFSVVGNIHQYNLSRQSRDNDLKYRQIRMWGGAGAEDIARLQAFFGYDRDKATVKLMRKRVEQYEQAVTEQAEKLEQARLNAIKAEQAREEAEKLKGKK